MKLLILSLFIFMQSIYSHGDIPSKNTLAHLNEKLDLLLESDEIDLESIEHFIQKLEWESGLILDPGSLFLRIIKSKKVNSHILTRIIYAIANSTFQIKETHTILVHIFKTRLLDSKTIKHLAYKLVYQEILSKNQNMNLMIAEILKNHKLDDDILIDLLLVIENTPILIEDAGLHIENIINRLATKSDVALGMVARTIAYSKFPIKDASSLLKKVIISKGASGYTLQMISLAISAYKWQIPNARELLSTAINMAIELKDSDALSMIAGALGNTKHDIEDKFALLEKIALTSLSHSDSLADTAFVLMNPRYTEGQVNSLLNIITFHDRADKNSNAATAYVIANTELRLKDTSLMLTQIASSEKTDGNGLAWVVRAVVDAKESILNGGDILKLVLNSDQAERKIQIYLLDAIKSAVSPIDNIEEVLAELRELGFE